jgi:hypothetical protein
MLNANEVTAIEESYEDKEDPSYAFNLSPVFAPVTIKLCRSSLSTDRLQHTDGIQKAAQPSSDCLANFSSTYSDS